MAIKKLIEINGETYKFEMLPGESAFELFLLLPEAFGGFVSAASKLIGKDSDSESIDSMQDVIKDAIKSINPQLLKKIAGAILPTVMVTNKTYPSGTTCSFSNFTGKIMVLNKVLFHALLYNFHDFFLESPLKVLIPKSSME